MQFQQQSAVQSYIDALLFEPTESLEGDCGRQKEESTKPVDEPLAKLSAAAGQAREAGPGSSAFVRHLELAQQKLHGHQQGNHAVPEWAGANVNCLVIKAANLKLAIPSEFIESVQPLSVGLVAHPGAQASSSGEMPEEPLPESILIEGVDDSVVDTAKLVMPERYTPLMRSGYRQKVVLKDANWSLAVDTIGSTTDYDSSKVRWRSAHTRRAWLAGTIIEEMCAILDIDAIQRMVLAEKVLADSPAEPGGAGE